MKASKDKRRAAKVARRENPIEAAQLDALRAEMKRDEEPLV